MAETQTTPTARTVTITAFIEDDGTYTYTVSDDGGNFDDETELEVSDATTATAERVADYKAEGCTIVLDLHSDVARFM